VCCRVVCLGVELCMSVLNVFIFVSSVILCLFVWVIACLLMCVCVCVCAFGCVCALVWFSNPEFLVLY